MRRRRLLALLPALIGVACELWRPNTPVTLHFRDPKAAYDVSVATLKMLGYNLARAEPERYHVEVASRLEGSFIAMQIYGDARMIIRAYGKLVKRGEMHRKLAAEIESIATALRASGEVVR